MLVFREGICQDGFICSKFQARNSKHVWNHDRVIPSNDSEILSANLYTSLSLYTLNKREFKSCQGNPGSILGPYMDKIKQHIPYWDKHIFVVVSPYDFKTQQKYT